MANGKAAGSELFLQTFGEGPEFEATLRQLTHPGNINTHKGKANRLSHFFEVFSRDIILYVEQSNARASLSLKSEIPTDIFGSGGRQKFAGEDMIQHKERGNVFRSGLNYGSKTRGRECECGS